MAPRLSHRELENAFAITEQELIEVEGCSSIQKLEGVRESNAGCGHYWRRKDIPLLRLLMSKHVRMLAYPSR